MEWRFLRMAEPDGVYLCKRPSGKLLIGLLVGNGFYTDKNKFDSAHLTSRDCKFAGPLTPHDILNMDTAINAIKTAAPWESCADYEENCDSGCNDRQCAALVEAMGILKSHSS